MRRAWHGPWGSPNLTHKIHLDHQLKRRFKEILHRNLLQDRGHHPDSIKALWGKAYVGAAGGPWDWGTVFAVVERFGSLDYAAGMWATGRLLGAGARPMVPMAMRRAAGSLWPAAIGSNYPET